SDKCKDHRKEQPRRIKIRFSFNCPHRGKLAFLLFLGKFPRMKIPLYENPPGMNRPIPIFLLIVTLATFLTGCISPSQEHAQDFATRQLDSLFDYYEQHELYFISARLSKNGDPFFQRA